MTYNSKLLAKIIHAVLTGDDHRKYILAIINERFVSKVNELVEMIFIYKTQNKNWIELVDDYSVMGDKQKLIWLMGLNQKTIRNMTGSSSKEVCIEIGKENLTAFKILLDGTNVKYRILITILHEKKSLILDDFESMIFINMISAMKSSIQGGAWSEVGKKTENALLATLFKYMQIPEDNFILISKDIQKNMKLSRETDGILFDRKGKHFKIELKLLGIGNPEVADEGLARDIQLFLVDSLTDMMVEQFKNKNIYVILFKNDNVLQKMYDFCKFSNIPCQKPESEITFEKTSKFVDEYQKKDVNITLLRKLKNF